MRRVTPLDLRLNRVVTVVLEVLEVLEDTARVATAVHPRDNNLAMALLQVKAATADPLSREDMANHHMVNSRVVTAVLLLARVSTENHHRVVLADILVSKVATVAVPPLHQDTRCKYPASDGGFKSAFSYKPGGIRLETVLSRAHE